MDKGLKKKKISSIDDDYARKTQRTGKLKYGAKNTEPHTQFTLKRNLLNGIKFKETFLIAFSLV